MVNDKPSLDSAMVCLYGLRAIYEERFCLFLQHEHGVDAEKHFRGNTISGCDRRVAPSKRVDKAIKHAKVVPKKRQKPNPRPTKPGFGHGRQNRRLFPAKNQVAAPQQHPPFQVTHGQGFLPQGRNANVICFKCHTYGHFADSCPNGGNNFNKKN
jgi:hypothetical protein